MATSGSYDFNLTGTNIILEALELIGKAGTGMSVEPEDQATCLRTLNMMVKALQAESVGLWKNVEGNLFLSDGGYSYDIGPTGDHCSVTAYKTEIYATSDLGDSSVTVDEDENITDGDYIGIELEDGTLQWTTVDGTPASNIVGLDDVLTDDVTVDSHVYNYTTKIQRPVEIIEARVVRSSGYEQPISIKSRDEYMRLSNKSSEGSVNQVYYDPLLTNGKMWVWQACGDVKEYIKFTCRIPIEDFDAASNDPDFPQEWLLALSYGLAVLVAPKFGVKLDQTFLSLASGIMKSAKDFDVENASVYFTMSGR